MEYLPSFRDSLYHSDFYNEFMYDEYLMHYGVPGMKWGVRKFTDSHGNRVKKARLGSAKRARQKQEMFRDKINNSKLAEGGIADNVVNTWREGRVNALEYKAKHREARNAYRKNRGSKTAKTNLRKARTQRLIYNGGQTVATLPFGGTIPAQLATTTIRGAYAKYRRNQGLPSTAKIQTKKRK